MKTNRIGVLFGVGLCLLMVGGGVRAGASSTRQGRVAAFLQMPPRRDVRLENVDGGAVALSQYEGKVVVLVLNGKDSAEASFALMRDVTVATAPEQDVVYVLAIDMRSAPSFFRGQVRSRVKGRLKEQRESFADAFRKAGLTYAPRHVPVILLDWRGSAAQAFGVRGNLDAAYQVLVLDRKGQGVGRFAQPDAKRGETLAAATVAKTIRATLASK